MCMCMSDPLLYLGPGCVSDAAEQTWLDFWLANLVARAPSVAGYRQFVTDGQAIGTMGICRDTNNV